MAHTVCNWAFIIKLELDNKTIQSLEWEKTRIEELDIRATELNKDTLISILTRLQYLRCKCCYYSGPGA